MAENEKSQSEKFIEKAKELGADESEKTFDDTLRRIAPVKPKGNKRPD